MCISSDDAIGKIPVDIIFILQAIKTWLQRKDFVPTPDRRVVQIYPAGQIDRIIKRTKTCISPLHQFLNKKLISNEHLLKWGMYSDEEDGVRVQEHTPTGHQL